MADSRRGRGTRRPQPTATPTATPTIQETTDTTADTGGPHDSPLNPQEPLDDAQTRQTSQLERMQQLLLERQAQRDEIESREQQRADTPLALELVVISCRWAVERWSGDATIPQFDFPQRKCWKGLARPNQDCRECIYVKPILYGTRTLGHHERRYHDSGMVFPLADDAAAEDLGVYLRDRGISHLRHIDQEIAWLEHAIAYARAEENAARERERLAAQEAEQRRQQQQQNVLRPPSTPLH